MRTCETFLTNAAVQKFRQDYIRNLPPVPPTFNNLWYAFGASNVYNQLIPLTGVGEEPSSICNVFPTSAQRFTELQFRDITSNGDTTFIQTSGSPSTIYAIGSNLTRILGPASPTIIRVLTAIEVGDFRKIRASSRTLWALSANGTLLYRGRNEPSGVVVSNVLTPLPGTFDDIEATNRGILALSGTEVYVKGFNRNGELGVGQLGVSRTSLINDLTPLTGKWKAMRSTSYGNMSFLLSANNNTNLWYAAGYNAYNSLGQGSIPTIDGGDVTQFVPIVGNWTNISVGSFHTLALTNDKKLFAAGYNDQGQLGLGTTGTGPVSTRRIYKASP